MLVGFSLIRSTIVRSREEQPLPAAPTTDPELVRYAAIALKKGIQVNNGWRVHGGHGLIHKDGVFVYGASVDGKISPPSREEDQFAGDDRRLEFDNEKLFLEWLHYKINEQGPCLSMSSPEFRKRLALAARYGLQDTPTSSDSSTRV